MYVKSNQGLGGEKGGWGRGKRERKRGDQSRREDY